MTKLRLTVCEFDSLSSTFPLWSKIYVTLDDIDFPSEHWYDATSSILEMWIHQVNSLICGSQRHAKLFFMDGDYYIDILAHNRICATIQCVNPGGIPIIYENIDLIYFGRQLLAAVGNIIKCFPRHDGSARMQALQSATKLLKETIKAVKQL